MRKRSLTMFILHLNNYQIFKPITPKWGDAAARSGSTVLRTRYLCKTPDDHDLGSIPGFRLIFARVFYNLLRDDSPWKQFRISTPISLRFRVKLIRIFSADHENVVYRNWLPKTVSAAPAKRWQAEKISLIILSSWYFRSAQLELGLSVWLPPFLSLRARGVLWPNGRAGIFKLINAVKGSVDKLPKGA